MLLYHHYYHKEYLHRLNSARCAIKFCGSG